MMFRNVLDRVLNFRLADISATMRAVHDAGAAFAANGLSSLLQKAGLTERAAKILAQPLGVIAGAATTATGVVLALGAVLTLAAGGGFYIVAGIAGGAMAAAVTAYGTGVAVEAQRNLFAPVVVNAPVPVEAASALDVNATIKTDFTKLAVCDMVPGRKNANNPGNLDPASNPYPGIYAPGPHMGD